MEEQQTPHTTPQQPAQPRATDPGLGLGIAGLIVAFFAPLIGLILSIVGVSKSKKAGFQNVPGIIGIIVSAIFMFFTVAIVIMIIIFASVPALQNNSRNTQIKNDVAILQSDLMEYYSENRGYPLSLSELYEDDLMASDQSNYTYTPSGCTNVCKSYTLSAELEGDGTYTVTD